MDPQKMSDDDRKILFDNGFSEADIFDIIDVASFFNYTNRMALGLDMMPNKEYHSMNR
jgi:alkylhydroperoxidase family enzyme